MGVTSTITIPRGNAITFTATATTPTNISGWNFAFTVRDATGRQVMQVTSGAGITTADSANGVLTIALTLAQTLQMPNVPYYWDLWRTDAGFEDQLASGPCVIPPSYWRP